MAIIINSKAGHNGKIVNIGEFIGKVDGWKHSDHWETDLELPAIHGGSIKSISETKLMRIDGFKEDTDIENEVNLLKQEIPILIKKTDKQIELLKISIADTLKRLDE